MGRRSPKRVADLVRAAGLPGWQALGREQFRTLTAPPPQSHDPKEG
jgi:hypothetical protein